MSDEIVKVCKVHGGLSINLVYKYPSGYLTCRECRRIGMRSTDSKRRERDDFRKYHQEYSAAYYQKNKEKIKFASMKWRQEDQNKGWPRNKKRAKKETINLEDRYIKRALYRKIPKLNCSQHSKEYIDLLILAKRLQIKYYRIFNQPMRRSK